MSRDLNAELNELTRKTYEVGTEQCHELDFKRREAVGDRGPGTVAWNLFDIDSKFGDVEPLSNVTEYLKRLPKFDETTTP